MTREELKYLTDIADRYDNANHNYYGYADVELDKDDADVIRKAVRELEQEQKTDIRECKNCKNSKDGYMAGTEECHECMWESKQEQKQGHWDKGYTFPDGEYWKCTKCKELIKVKYPMKYCNNCGSKNE